MERNGEFRLDLRNLDPSRGSLRKSLVTRNIAAAPRLEGSSRSSDTSTPTPACSSSREITLVTRRDVLISRIPEILSPRLVLRTRGLPVFRYSRDGISITT